MAAQSSFMYNKVAALLVSDKMTATCDNTAEHYKASGAMIVK